MNVFVAVLIAGSLCTVKGNESDRALVEKCMNEVGITLEAYESGSNSDIENINDKIKCVDACLLKGYDVMREDGSMDSEKILQLLPDYPVELIDSRKVATEKCITRKGESDCDTAYMLMMCLNEEIKKLSD